MFFKNSSEKLSIATLKRGGFSEAQINSMGAEQRITEAQKILEQESAQHEAALVQDEIANTATMLAADKVSAADVAPHIPQTLEETGLRLLALESRLEQLLAHLQVKL